MMRRFYIEPLGENNRRLQATFKSDTLNLAVLGGDIVIASDPAVVKHVLTGELYGVRERQRMELMAPWKAPDSLMLRKAVR